MTDNYEPLAPNPAVVEDIRKIRQARLYTPDPVPSDTIDTLLEIARWTGSARNTQPWHFIVIEDKETLAKLAALRTPINWVADAPLAIATVLDGLDPQEAYDEGRVTERLLIAARLLGLGGGIAWFGDAAQEAEGKRILGIPEDRTARQVVVIGKPVTTRDHRPNRNTPGRKPREETISRERYGAR
ncbi:MAG: nitroreductase family protein [Thermomicrobiales bacterium]